MTRASHVLSWQTWLSVVLYSMGFLITALGIILVLRSDFGAGPWDAVPYNLRALTGITLGTASFIINMSILIFILSYRRRIRYLFMLVPIVSMATAIDLWDLWLIPNLIPSNVMTASVFFVVGLVFISLGLAATVVSGFPAMVFEEWTLALMELFKTRRFYRVRIGIECLAVVLAAIFGFLAGVRFGAIGLGTVLIALSIGPMIHIFMRHLRVLLKRPE